MTMLICMPLLTWDAFALTGRSRRTRPRRRLIDWALRAWRGLLPPPPLRPA